MFDLFDKGWIVAQKPEENKPWMIRDVPEEVRRDVKVYAAQHSVTVAEALAALVMRGFKALSQDEAAMNMKEAEERGIKPSSPEEINANLNTLFTHSTSWKIFERALAIAAEQLKPEIDAQYQRFNQMRMAEGLPSISYSEFVTQELEAAGMPQSEQKPNEEPEE